MIRAASVTAVRSARARTAGIANRAGTNGLINRATVRAEIPERGPSGRRQKPAAQSVVTERARSRFASSSEAQPPSEIPEA